MSNTHSSSSVVVVGKVVVVVVGVVVVVVIGCVVVHIVELAGLFEGLVVLLPSVVVV